MRSITVAEILDATGGTLLFGDTAKEINRVEIDSRKTEEVTLFVPLVGERVDAHRFLADVLAKGGVALTEKEMEISRESGSLILVEDTLQALQRLGGWYRRQFQIPIVGITGSVGKTTTKEMIGAVLSSNYQIVKTKGNLNSQIGVALMMFEIQDDTEIAIIEMGMSLPGEMEQLVEIVRPEVAVITNIGVSHIGNLGSRENIAFEKGHIVTYAKDVFFCGDGDMRKMAENIPWNLCERMPQVHTYGLEEDVEIRGKDLELRDGKEIFSYEYGTHTGTVCLSVLGRHYVENALVALALGNYFHVDEKAGIHALEEYKPYQKRGVVEEIGTWHVIDDTYNASPDSITSNVEALFDRGEGGFTVAVLGDVLELGEDSEKLHRGVGTYLAQMENDQRGISMVITVGTEARFIAEELKDSNLTTASFETCEQAAAYAREHVPEGAWILVKGSRGMHMEDLIERLK